jgi:hypothetical protein
MKMSISDDTAVVMVKAGLLLAAFGAYACFVTSVMESSVPSDRVVVPFSSIFSGERGIKREQAARMADATSAARYDAVALQKGGIMSKPKAYEELSKDKLVWVTNVHQTDLKSGEVRFINGFEGKPQGTKAFSEIQLSKEGAIGIYKREGDEQFQIISQTSTRELHSAARDFSLK